MKAIVTGMIATYPVGGVAWDYGQYALGLERLGCEVYYLEDTGCETYDPVRALRRGFLVRSLVPGSDRSAELSPTLAERWHFRAMDGTSFGLAGTRFEQVAAEADLFLNVSGGTLLRDAYMACPCKVLIDTDPGWNHFVNFPKWDANPGWQQHAWLAGARPLLHVRRADRQSRLRAARLGHPLEGRRAHRWCSTSGSPEPPGRTWTTVMTWDNFRRPIVHAGVEYGTKEREFQRIEALPSRDRGAARGGGRWQRSAPRSLAASGLVGDRFARRFRRRSTTIATTSRPRAASSASARTSTSPRVAAG